MACCKSIERRVLPAADLDLDAQVGQRGEAGSMQRMECRLLMQNVSVLASEGQGGFIGLLRRSWGPCPADSKAIFSCHHGGHFLADGAEELCGSGSGRRNAAAAALQPRPMAIRRSA